MTPWLIVAGVLVYFAGTAQARPSVDELTALARVIRSESGSYTEAERYAIGWVTRNRARYKRVTIAKLVCSPTCGHGGGGRWASSAQAPEQSDYLTAARVLGASSSQDPTHGAIDAFEPALQDRLAASGRPGYTADAAAVRASWGRSMDRYAVIGHWEFYGLKRRGGATT